MASILPVSGGSGAHWPAHIAPTSPGVPRLTGRDGRFDQVAFSAGTDGTQRFRMDLVSRLSQEVRATTTTGDIQALRQQVTSGEYKPDATEIAARILLMKGAEA